MCTDSSRLMFAYNSLLRNVWHFKEGVKPQLSLDRKASFYGKGSLSFLYAFYWAFLYMYDWEPWDTATWKTHMYPLSGIFYTLTLFSIVDSMVNLQSEAMQKTKQIKTKHPTPQTTTTTTQNPLFHLLPFKSTMAQLSENTCPKDFLY